jgi:hypothetical protein
MIKNAPPAVDLSSSQSAIRVRAVFRRIAAAWNLGQDEAAWVMGKSGDDYARWLEESAPRLDEFELLRLSYVFNIYADLAVHLPKPERAHAWLKRPNSAPMFGGITAMDFLMGGGVERLAAVAAYLASERGD